MGFDEDKKNILEKTDKSKKGSIDFAIKPLCDLINSKSNFFTTSSCAGRITISKISDSGKKNTLEWLLVSHEKVDIKQVNDALGNLPKEAVWFRFEPFIIHINCRNLESAELLLKLMRSAGFKRTGIVALGKKIIIEIISSDRLELLIAEKVQLLVNKDYLRLLVEKSNRFLDKNHKRINRLFCEIQKIPN